MKYLIVLLSITQTYAYWEPIFLDEFNYTESLDENKWIIESEQETCKGNQIQQLNCNTNSKTNVRLINGTLALTAVEESYLNKKYTSSVINSRESFTFGKFEIKAALPSGKMLRPVISLKATTLSGKWPDNGEIVILSNKQKNILEFGIYFVSRGQPKYVGEKFSISTNLKDFHTYILEWNEKEMSFKFDGIRLAIIDFFKELKDSYNPFLKPFTLSLGLGVGGVVFKNQVLTDEDVKEWNCSALIVDYVRVHQWIDGKSLGKAESKPRQSKNEPTIDSDQKSSAYICDAIMHDIRAGQNQNIKSTAQTSTVLASTQSTEIVTSTPTSKLQLNESNSVMTQTHSITNSTPQTILGEIHVEEI